MAFDLIAFVACILFGMVLYWRESKGNSLYRFFNKVLNSKELQMKAEDKKGFVYQQSLVLRIVFITALFLTAIIALGILIPIDFNVVSMFLSGIFGTLAGTYLSHFVISSGEVIEEQSESITDIVSDTIEKGKDFIEDIRHPESAEPEQIEDKEPIEPAKEKSARERLKDKGLL